MFPEASFACQVTELEPVIVIGKPSRVIACVGCIPQKSVPVAELGKEEALETKAIFGQVVALIVMFAGQVIVGGTCSVTVKVRLQVPVLPLPSFAA